MLQDAKHNLLLVIQDAVELAQAAYADEAPEGCGRIVRKELKGQQKLRQRLLDAGYESVLTEGQVPIAVTLDGHLKGRYDLLIDGNVVLELKNASKLNDQHVTQISEYMTALGVQHGVLINFPKDARTAIDAKEVIFKNRSKAPSVTV